MRARHRLLRVLLGVLAIGTLTVGPAPADDYVAGSTFVARSSGGTVVDFGVVECNTVGGPSVGGACIPWSAGGQAIEVVDDHNGRDVAFQVCVDNDGDHLCGGLPTIAGCNDDIVFSHFDDGSFSNPLAAPTSFRTGCPGGFRGWVVFLCQGTHATTAPHTHEVTTGRVTAAASGGPSGEFCGAPLGKPYVRATASNACFGQGTMQTSVPLSALQTRTAGFTLLFSLGSCLAGNTAASGTLTGTCFNATGTGQFSSGRKFNVTWAGPLMELTPVGGDGAAGTLTVVPDATVGSSCQADNASRFVTTAVVYLP